MSIAEANTLIGTTVGDYELVSKIGAGGIGTVYLARTPRDMSRWFAVKVLHDEMAGGWNAGTLADQVTVGNSLRHVNVSPVIDAGFAGHRRYVVSEYVAGATLKRVVRDARPSAGAVAAIMCDVLGGLDAIHRAADSHGRSLGLVHRDVSPDNVLVGLDGRARIADFDIAKATLKPNKKTRPGLIKGKYSYMSPEQISGLQLDQRSDIFAAGIVLYNMLTGTALFDGRSLESLVIDLLDRPIPLPSSVGSRPDPRYDAVVMRALERDPGERFQSAAGMREALMWAAGDQLASPGDVSRLVMASAGRALNGVMLEHLHTVASLKSRASAGPTQPPVPRRKRRRLWIAASIFALSILAGTVSGVYTSSAEAQRSPSTAPDTPVAMQARVSPTLSVAAGERQAAEAVAMTAPIVPATPVAPALDAVPISVGAASGLTRAVVARSKSRTRPARKAEPKTELKAEPKAEPKTELKAEAKTERKAEPKTERKAEPETKTEAKAKTKRRKKPRTMCPRQRAAAP